MRSALCLIGCLALPLSGAQAGQGADPVCERVSAEMRLALEDIGRFGVESAVLAVEAPAAGRFKARAGVTRRSHGHELTGDEVFLIGSQTKMFVAAAVVKLAAEGRLDLDAPAADLAGGLSLPDGVTVWHLLHHQSGLGDGVRYFDVPGPAPRMKVDFEDIALFSNLDGAKFEPGAGWRYNNFGFRVLARIVEETAGEELGAYLRRAFFDPLGMSATGVAALDAWPDGPMAHGYWTSNGILEDMGAPHEVSWAIGAGDMYAAADDLILWMRALGHTDCLAGACLSTMTQTAVATPAPEMPLYGAGLMQRSFGGRLAWGHGGFIQGYMSYSAIDPESGAVLALLAALDGAPDTDYALLMERLSSVIQQTFTAVAVAQAAAGASPGGAECGNENHQE